MSRMLKDYSYCRLGRAILRATSAEGFPDDFNWDFVSPDGLAVRDAWAMATTWADVLRGHVSLAIDETEALFAAIPNDEWIEVEIGCCDAQQAAAAHASSLVWRALAACRGYGASENPVFWRRLFDELRQKELCVETSKRRCSVSHFAWAANVTDARRFFDGVVFPRFKVNLPRDAPFESTAHCVRIFCGVDQPVADDGNTGKLRTILDRLRTVVKVNRLVKSIEVALHLHPKQKDEPLVNELVSTIRDCSTTVQDRDPLQWPSYSIPHLYLGDRWFRFPNAEQRNWYVECGSATTTLITSRGIAHEYTLPFMRFLRWAICSDWSQSTECVGIKELQFFHGDDDYCIPAICASLPVTRSLETLRLVSYDTWYHSIDEQDLAWIGYALFHPDAAKSSWRRLVFEVFYMQYATDRATPTQVWELMARGNNLAVVLGHTTTVADAYYTATLKPGAVLRRRVGHEDIVEVLERATEIDVCVTTTDLDTLDEWVMVVVVGYGEAWVQSHWIDSITARPPRQAKLTAMVFSDLEIDLPTLLCLVGPALECLDLRGISPSRISSIAQHLAQWCPQLTTLLLPLYNDVSPAVELPISLRHLRIAAKQISIVLPLIQSNQDHLVHLETMHVSTNSALLTETEVVECVTPVLRALPRLRHCNWISGNLYSELGSESRNKKRTLTYAMQRYFSRELLQPMALDGPDTLALTNSRAPTDSLVALLSVIANAGVAGSALSGLDNEMVLLIGGFIGTFVRRTVWAAGTSDPKYVVNPEWQGPLPRPLPASALFDFEGHGSDY